MLQTDYQTTCTSSFDVATSSSYKTYKSPQCCYQDAAAASEAEISSATLSSHGALEPMCLQVIAAAQCARMMEHSLFVWTYTHTSHQSLIMHVHT